MTPWFVYMVRTPSDAIYTGITTDVERRVEVHASGRGAKFLRGRGPLQLEYVRRIGDRGLAQKIEARLKRLTKEQKEQLVLAAPSRRSLVRRLKLAEKA